MIIEGALTFHNFLFVLDSQTFRTCHFFEVNLQEMFEDAHFFANGTFFSTKTVKTHHGGGSLHRFVLPFFGLKEAFR